VAIGSEADITLVLLNLQAKPSTPPIERTKLDWRLWKAHLTRQSVTFASSIRWLEAKLVIYVVWHNKGLNLVN
jgi:hypothetical protein